MESLARRAIARLATGFRTTGVVGGWMFLVSDWIWRPWTLAVPLTLLVVVVVVECWRHRHPAARPARGSRRLGRGRGERLGASVHKLIHALEQL